MDNKLEEWNLSYSNNDNFVFYPHEEVIRFVSKYITKRIGLNEFNPVHQHQYTPKVLDIGCGIGRHVFYCHQMGLNSYGVDLSKTAVDTARQWATLQNFSDSKNRIVQGDIQSLPWEERSFDYAISHGVFDSMYYNLAKVAIKQVARVLENNALFYCDFISGDDSKHSREYSGEEIIETEHERGTVQTYYNYSKILDLIGTDFKILEANLIRRENILNGDYNSRYHIVLEKL